MIPYSYLFTRLILILLPPATARILRLPCKQTANFQKSATNVTLNGGTIVEFTFKTMYKCVKECLMNRRCKTFSAHVTKRRCKLHDRNSTDPGISLVPADGWILYQTNWKQKKVKDIVTVLMIVSDNRILG